MRLLVVTGVDGDGGDVRGRSDLDAAAEAAVDRPVYNVRFHLKMMIRQWKLMDFPLENDDCLDSCWSCEYKLRLHYIYLQSG